METLMSVRQVAERAGVHWRTVYGWLRAGDLHGVRLGRAKGWRVTEDDWRAFLAARREAMGYVSDAGPA
jgi:excisionase family DNA binding protein